MGSTYKHNDFKYPEVVRSGHQSILFLNNITYRILNFDAEDSVKVTGLKGAALQLGLCSQFEETPLMDGLKDPNGLFQPSAYVL